MILKICCSRKDYREIEGYSTFTARVQGSRIDWSETMDMLSPYIEEARFVGLHFQTQLNTMSLKFADKC